MITLTDLPAWLAERIDVHGGVPAAPLRPVPGECWNFKSWHSRAGYPFIRHEGRDHPAHRVVHVAATGADLTGLELDHVCRNRACVNPNHEEPVTHAENQRRMGQAQMACRKSGHDWADPDNVRTRPNGRRYCAECDRIALRERYKPTGRPQHGTQSTCKKGHALEGDNLYISTYPDGRFRQRRCRECMRQNNRKRAGG